MSLSSSSEIWGSSRIESHKCTRLSSFILAPFFILQVTLFSSVNGKLMYVINVTFRKKKGLNAEKLDFQCYRYFCESLFHKKNMNYFIIYKIRVVIQLQSEAIL